MTIILPTGVGFILGRIFTPRATEPENVETIAEKVVVAEETETESLPTAA